MFRYPPPPPPPPPPRIIRGIEKGEARILRRLQIMQSIRSKMARYDNPWTELRIAYGTNKGKYYTEESDRFMVRG